LDYGKTDLEGEMEEDEEGQGDEAEEAAHHLQHRPQPIRIQYLLQHRSTNQHSVFTSAPLNQSEFSIDFTTAQPTRILCLLQHRSTDQHSGIVQVID
jgi:hypothetical protein